MILLNDILNFQTLDNVKIRFNLMFNQNWNPIEYFKNGDEKIMSEGQYWNYPSKKSYSKGQITIGFIRIPNKDDLWLLFHVGRVTKDLNIYGGVGYEYEILTEYEKYFGRLIVRFKNRSQTMIRRAVSVIKDCEVTEILSDIFDNDIFPGYDWVSISWQELSRVINKESWKTALRNQKGIYLLTDNSNGKMYVGSASGENMLLGRWQSYLKNGHGDNSGLKKLDFEYIKENFSFSILDIYKSTTDDQIILDREKHWKRVLKTRGEFGYNEN